MSAQQSRRTHVTLCLAMLGAAAAAPINIVNGSDSGLNRTAPSRSGCGSAPISSGNHYITVQDPLGGSVRRRFRVYVPQNYDQFAATPLIMDFHGYSITADRHEEESAFRQVADEFNLIVVWPHGLDDTVVANQQAYSWNSVGTVASPGPFGETCRWASSSAEYSCHTSCRGTRGCQSNTYGNGCDCSTCVDDVLFTELMMNYLEDELCVDQDRIHATGFSNGGMFVYQLAQSRLAARIASVAPVASAPLLGFNLGPTRPGMAILDFHGSRDSVIPANCSGNRCGPGGSTISSDGFYYVPTVRIMNSWGETNGCSGEAFHFPTRFDGNTDLYCMGQEGRCPNNGDVIRCTHNGAHAYPFGNGGQARRNFATLAYEFFTQHPLN